MALALNNLKRVDMPLNKETEDILSRYVFVESLSKEVVMIVVYWREYSE